MHNTPSYTFTLLRVSEGSICTAEGLWKNILGIVSNVETHYVERQLRLEPEIPNSNGDRENRNGNKRWEHLNDILSKLQSPSWGSGRFHNIEEYSFKRYSIHQKGSIGSYSKTRYILQNSLNPMQSPFLYQHKTRVQNQA